MSVSIAIHPRAPHVSPRGRVRALWSLALAAVAAVALAAFAAAAPSNGRIAPNVSHSSSNPAPLGLVRDPNTGQWTCIRVTPSRATVIYTRS